MRDDVGFLDDVRRALVSLPVDCLARAGLTVPAGRTAGRLPRRLRRVALLATGGSGALASVVGVGTGVRGARACARR